jgi:hypothetical protein
MRIVVMRKLKLLSSSFIMALTLAAPFATYAMEPGEDHKAPPASRRFLCTYLGAALELDMPILEAIYYSAPPQQFERFLNGKLIYKPDPNSDEGMVVMPIADLPNPLDGKFDLSKCGNASAQLSINTGYHKGKRPENEMEIWFAPHFLIKKNLEGSASHFKGIMDSWNPLTAPVGTFFTWGDWDDLNDYGYATKLSWDSYNDPENNLRKIHFTHTSLTCLPTLHRSPSPSTHSAASFFMLFLIN